MAFEFLNVHLPKAEGLKSQLLFRFSVEENRKIKLSSLIFFYKLVFVTQLVSICHSIT